MNKEQLTPEEQYKDLRKFLLNKYPTDKYLDCPIDSKHYAVIEEYALLTQQRSEQKELLLEKFLDFNLNKSALEEDNTFMKGWISALMHVKVNRQEWYKQQNNG